MRVDVVVSTRAASHAALEGLAARDPRFRTARSPGRRCHGSADARRRAFPSAAAAAQAGSAARWDCRRLWLCLPRTSAGGAWRLQAWARRLSSNPMKPASLRQVVPSANSWRSPTRSHSMSQAAFGLVDGRGTLRVASACEDLVEGITLRVAGAGGWRAGLALAQCPGCAGGVAGRWTRSRLPSHLDWYGRAITNPRSRDPDRPGRRRGLWHGPLRRRTCDGTWDVSIALDPARTGRGLGTRLLAARRARGLRPTGLSAGSLQPRARRMRHRLRAFAACGFTHWRSPRGGWVAMTAERGLAWLMREVTIAGRPHRTGRSALCASASCRATTMVR
jgi:GNAT superfamily N-acetyltransferase